VHLLLICRTVTIINGQVARESAGNLRCEMLYCIEFINSLFCLSIDSVWHRHNTIANWLMESDWDPCVE